jgi:UDP-N-acetyl-D-glucosamine dehydrogenase
MLPILERGGLKAGKDFFLAFSPERENPGDPVYGVENTPKVVGGITKNCLLLADMLYSQVVARTVPLSSTRAAESTKLLENIFRLRQYCPGQ